MSSISRLINAFRSTQTSHPTPATTRTQAKFRLTSAIGQAMTSIAGSFKSQRAQTTHTFTPKPRDRPVSRVAYKHFFPDDPKFSDHGISKGQVEEIEHLFNQRMAEAQASGQTNFEVKVSKNETGGVSARGVVKGDQVHVFIVAPKVLGKGAERHVKAVLNESGRLVAYQQKLNTEAREQSNLAKGMLDPSTKAELELLAPLQHPNVGGFHTVIRREGDAKEHTQHQLAMLQSTYAEQLPATPSSSSSPEKALENTIKDLYASPDRAINASVTEQNEETRQTLLQEKKQAIGNKILNEAFLGSRITVRSLNEDQPEIMQYVFFHLLKTSPEKLFEMLPPKAQKKLNKEEFCQRMREAIPRQLKAADVSTKGLPLDRSGALARVEELRGEKRPAIFLKPAPFAFDQLVLEKQAQHQLPILQKTYARQLPTLSGLDSPTKDLEKSIAHLYASPERAVASCQEEKKQEIRNKILVEAFTGTPFDVETLTQKFPSAMKEVFSHLLQTNPENVFQMLPPTVQKKANKEEFSQRVREAIPRELKEAGVSTDGLPLNESGALAQVESVGFEEAHRTTLADRKQLLLGLTRGVSYLHQQGVVHRDLKPANIRLSAAGESQVIDFGGAINLTQLTPHERTQIFSQGLTESYCAKEMVEVVRMVNGDQTYDKACGYVEDKNQPGRIRVRKESEAVDLTWLYKQSDVHATALMALQQLSPHLGSDRFPPFLQVVVDNSKGGNLGFRLANLDWQSDSVKAELKELCDPLGELGEVIFNIFTQPITERPSIDELGKAVGNYQPPED